MKSSADVTFDSLIDGWANEAKPKQATLDQWRSDLRDFQKTIGITNAAAVTEELVIEWKEALLKRGLAAKTANDTTLAALSRVLAWGAENKKIAGNVAKGIRVKQKRKAGTKMRGYSDEQASVILEAAIRSNSPVYRWIPWLCCLTGARVAEMTQLRRSDVRERGGIHFLRLCTDAGSVKNEGSERDVPLHPLLIKQGFLRFVEGSKDGHLFFDPSKRRKLDRRSRKRSSSPRTSLPGFTRSTSRA